MTSPPPLASTVGTSPPQFPCPNPFVVRCLALVATFAAQLSLAPPCSQSVYPLPFQSLSFSRPTSPPSSSPPPPQLTLLLRRQRRQRPFGQDMDDDLYAHGLKKLPELLAGPIEKARCGDMLGSCRWTMEDEGGGGMQMRST